MNPTTAILLAILLVLSATSPAAAQGQPAPPLDPNNGTWHIGLDKLWGVNNKNEGRRLDIYPVFIDGKWVNALATARNFNTSIHLIEESDVKVDAAAKTVSGKIKVLITPDTWVPKDGQPFYIEAEIRGKLEPQAGGAINLTGTYTARRTDGKPINEQQAVVESNLIGAVGRTDTGWENSVWTFPMNQIADPDSIDLDLIDITLGIADGKVNWGTIGITPQAKMPTVKKYPLDVSNFEPVSAAGVARGSVVVTGRHLHPGGDPNAKYRIDVLGLRVQGLAGGKATIVRLENGQPTGEGRLAAGRGTCTKGGGDKADLSALWRHDLNTDPWWVPVKGFVAPAAGEHPRLLFRKSDVPALRQRAQSDLGKAIIVRLRQTLGNDGEALPTRFNETPPHNHDQSPDMPLGTFTTWHAAGYGFLYQLTGDRKYADMARQCAQWMLDGKMDIDNRYAWWKPGTDLRCGSVLGAMAYAYDFCYDAWPDDFRRKIALEIQNFDKLTASAEESAKAKGTQPETTSIKKLAGRSGYPPGSNHYGSLIGGTGVAMLAIKGDPGVDNAFVDARLAEIESNMPRMLELGFGDGGWYAEGLPPSRLSANGGFVELMHAMKCAAGRDYINAPRPNAAWITLRWVMHLGGSGYSSVPSRGTYGGDELYGKKGGLSGSGDFAFGFGAVPEKYKAALLWSHQTFVEPFEKGKYGTTGEQKTYNVHDYPHRAIFSFLHWPDGKAQNPAEVLPLCAVDRIHGYFIARNRWQDADDIIVTHLLEYGPRGYYVAADGKRNTDRPGTLRIWGHGLRTFMTTNTAGSSVTAFVPGKDGSFLLTMRKGGPTGMAVDFSKASGADLVVALVGPAAVDSRGAGRDKPATGPKANTQYQQLKVGDAPAYVFTMQTGQAPQIKADGDKLLVGGQTYTWDGRILQPATFTPSQ